MVVEAVIKTPFFYTVSNIARYEHGSCVRKAEYIRILFSQVRLRAVLKTGVCHIIIFWYKNGHYFGNFALVLLYMCNNQNN